MNSVQLVGNLCHNIKLTTAKNGAPRIAFKLAVDRRGRGGRADIFDIVAWRAPAQILAKHLEKGEKIALTGYLQHQEWDGEDGERYQSVVVVVDTFTFCGRASVDAPESEEGAECTDESAEDLSSTGATL